MPPAPRFHSQRTLAPQQAPGLYHSTYDPELGAAICRRIAAGESLRAICADPAMPTGKTVWNWARAHEDFALMKAHALSAARAASLAAQGARDDAQRAVWDRPGRRTAWNAGLDGYEPNVAGQIVMALTGGATLASVCAGPAMPSMGTVYNWLRRRPEFLADYRAAKAAVEDVMHDEACDRLQWEGMRKSFVTLRRTERAVAKAARRKSLKRYAPAAGPAELKVTLEEPDGTRRVIYGGDERY